MLKQTFKSLGPARLTFKNLGPVRDAKLDLRPLTVIIGANNTGKTYLAYATYALFNEALPAPIFRSWGPFDALTTRSLLTSMQLSAARVVDGLRKPIRLSPLTLTEVFQDPAGDLSMKPWRPWTFGPSTLLRSSKRHKESGRRLWSR